MANLKQGALESIIASVIDIFSIISIDTRGFRTTYTPNGRTPNLIKSNHFNQPLVLLRKKN